MLFGYVISEDVWNKLCKFHVINPYNTRDITWRSRTPQNQKSQHSEQAFLYFLQLH